MNMVHYTRCMLVLTLVLGGPLGAQDVFLDVGDTVRASLSTGDTLRYTVRAQADVYIRGAVNQISVDVVIRLVGPDGEVIRSIDGPARGPEPFQFVTDADGDYRIEVSPFEDEEGAFALALDRVEPVATEPEALADQLLSAYDGEDSPGAVVSVFKDGETVFSRAYGMANLTYGIPFEIDTRTNIGSTSKQFTAFAIMLLVERGELSLDDDVRTHIPELPDFGEAVTVRNLLTHTTGYREFLNLISMTGRRLDHADYIDRDELIEIVQRQPALQNAPGGVFNYNNTAFGLAAIIVERISGQSFPEFLQEHVFAPLGMTRTLVRLSPEHIVAGQAEGYTPDADSYRAIGDLSGAIGAGGIYSTVGDLQKWVENLASPTVGSRAIVEQMTTRFVLTDGDTTNYGLGLFVDEHRGLRRVNHGGADVAHRSQLVYYPEINAGLTTQSNHAAFDGSIPFQLAEAFFAEYMEPEEDDAADTVAFDPTTFDPEAFDEFAGRYALDERPSFVLTFSREDDTFYTQATGQPRLEIVPTSDSSFSLVAVEASVTFLRNGDGDVDALMLYQNGERRATRLADGDGPWSPTVDDLEAYVGRYFSHEIETFYTVALEEEHLVLRQRRLDDRTLRPGDEDDFTAGGTQVSFERDRNEQVIAFYLSNVRTRDVRFERIDW
jgi:CubicO group peptidase (beta-lactamase class C family)